MSTTWLHVEAHGDVPTYRLGRDGTAIVAEWSGLATYRSDRSPRLVAEVGADPRRIEKIRSGAARALDRAIEMRWSFHGAAAAIDGDGILFVGASGAGKSTVAAACVASGAHLLADDIAFVDDVEGVLHLSPGERHHWIAEADAARLGTVNREPAAPSNERGKAPFLARSVAVHPVPLRMVCEILPDRLASAPVVEQLHGIDAMRAISPALFLLPLEDEERLAAHLDCVARVAHETRVVRVRRPVSGDAALVAAELRHARMVSRA